LVTRILRSRSEDYYSSYLCIRILHFQKLSEGTMEKKRRNDLEQINLDAAGIDIGSEFHYVSVPEDRDEQSVRRFECFTADLRAMAEWLRRCKITTIAMESTGVYWIPVFQILESYGFEVLLVNAYHLKNVSGRKSDVKDCQWIQQLHTYGLLNGSFQPENKIKILRTYIRQREKLIKDRSSHIQRMQKNLVQMNIQLHKVISDITGLTGMKIMRSILSGERDPHTLAMMKNWRIKRSVEAISRALEGDYRDELIFCLKQEVEHYDFICRQIDECDKMIEATLENLTEKKEDEQEIVSKEQRLKDVCGVDLTLIDGVDVHTVETIISEIGIDPGKWRNEKHFGSWLGLAPNHKISGGKVLSRKTKKVVSRAATAFRLAAWGVSHSKSAIGSFYRRIRARAGAPVAITATAYKIARMFYKCLKEKLEYNDIGADYYEQKYRERVIKNLAKKARELGYRLEVDVAA
jgi:transposase